MAGSFLFQDWTTLRGSVQTTVITQNMNEYVDLVGYKDLLVFLDIADYTNVTFATQTSPSTDEALFQAMGTPVTIAGIGPQVVKYLYASATVPLARFVRWQVTGAAAGSWSITFRAWLSPNQSAQTRRPEGLQQRLQKAHDDALKKKPPLASDAPHPTVFGS